MKEQIHFYEGYKYQLERDYTIQTTIAPREEISTRFIRLGTDGVLTIRADYAWDGPSGPTFDTDCSMRASLVHDALYQLIAAGALDPRWRELADRELARICIEDGMPEFRAAAWYRAVQLFGGGHLAEDVVRVAPLWPTESAT